jgi:hypothetical protein
LLFRGATFARDRRALDDFGRVGVEYVAGKHMVALGFDTDVINAHSTHPNKVLFIGLKQVLQTSNSSYSRRQDAPLMPVNRL